MCVYIYTHTYMQCIYLYIEREIEREGAESTLVIDVSVT